jgi:hypothetical protein
MVVGSGLSNIYCEYWPCCIIWPTVGEPLGAVLLNGYAIKSSGIEVYRDLFKIPSLRQTGIVLWLPIWSNSFISLEACVLLWSLYSLDVIGVYAWFESCEALAKDVVENSEGCSVNGGRLCCVPSGIVVVDRGVVVGWL